MPHTHPFAHLFAINLSHRIVQAPLTRLRSEQPGDVPGDLMATHYGQRASKGGLQIAEATHVSVTGRGYLGAPGIYSDEQVAGWRKVTDAVHAKGGKIFLQLWHVGRQSHVDVTGGVAPVTASEVPFEQVVFTKDGWVPVSPARALKIEEIPGIVDEFRQGAVRAKAAGFDGVEVHGANGYLLDQFLQDGVNKRTDAYGGPVENRARLLLEVVEAVVGVWGKGRVAVRLGPSGTWASMSDSNPEKTFGYHHRAPHRRRRSSGRGPAPGRRGADPQAVQGRDHRRRRLRARRRRGDRRQGRCRSGGLRPSLQLEPGSGRAHPQQAASDPL